MAGTTLYVYAAALRLRINARFYFSPASLRFCRDAERSEPLKTVINKVREMQKCRKHEVCDTFLHHIQISLFSLFRVLLEIYKSHKSCLNGAYGLACLKQSCADCGLAALIHYHFNRCGIIFAARYAKRTVVVKKNSVSSLKSLYDLLSGLFGLNVTERTVAPTSCAKSSRSGFIVLPDLDIATSAGVLVCIMKFTSLRFL